MISSSTLGRLFFSLALVASGILQLATGEFVRLVPQLPAWVPEHSFLAYLVGVILILAGAAIGFGRGALGAAVVVGAMLVLVLACLQIPKALTDPRSGFMWTNPFKALALLGGLIVLANTVLANSLPEIGAPSGLARLFRRLAPLGPLFFSAFLILGGIQHFVYVDFVMKLVPEWIPGSRYWAYFTGLALVAGGVGILVPRMSRLAATMVGIMILLWVVLLHIPRAIGLHSAAETAAIFEALAMSGVAFLLADRERGLPRVTP
ncbi:MAG TPA: hypothetical protein VGG20_24685 [Thermoanaerobaculia bacterium]|jgi:uncharacterized membrane protein